MNTGGGLNNVPNTEPPPPGSETFLTQEKDPVAPKTTPVTSKVLPSSKGVENAKKRLRAFSIQKKTPLSPIVVPKTVSSGNTTVLIGKLSSVKVTPKVEDPDQKKLPKPPKPGTSRRSFQDSYTDLQKRTLAEIEDMKRKMELVELGIPLGLICPTSTSEKAMPTKAMPPIKSFLDPQKVDEIIREAKKAKLEGKEFKFNYQKLLPDYDNPFQRKKDEYDKDRKSDRRRSESEKDKDRRKSDKYESRRHDHRKDDAKYKERDREKTKEKKKEEVDNTKQKDKTVDKETDVNLNDYLICDSWSLDNDDKNSIASPKGQEKSHSTEAKVVEPSEQLKVSIAKKKELLKTCAVDNPTKNVPVKIEKLQPVIDSFKFEIDPNDDEVLDIFDEDSDLEKFAHQKKIKSMSLYDATDKNVVDYNIINTKETSMDGLNDDTFLESVINEIKENELSDDNSQDKGLVEYDISPNRDEESPRKPGKSSKCGSVTPEMLEKGRSQSQKSDYSEGYRSSDSFKTNESGYKSVESYKLSVEKELDDALQSKMSKSTVDSLETWSFVLKICQPLLFRHDKKKCYKETRSAPKIWYTENPKGCNCVKDRAIVYEELEMCKMSLVDRVYGCDQISDPPFPTQRNWYARSALSATESNPIPLSNEWEAEDSQQALRPTPSGPSKISGLSGLSGLSASTPQKSDEISLDREYQRFMESVWPEGADAKTETSRSTTPVRQEARKKKKEEDKDTEEKKSKKIKLSSEGWSQESDLEEDDKSKKMKIHKEKSKTRKRKHSSSSSISSSLSDSDDDSSKRAKLLKKKALKKTKSKSAKRRRIGRKILKRLKEKQKKRKHDRDSDDDEDGSKKKDKKSKKKKQQKLKKKAQKKKKKQSSSSSSSSSDSTSDTDSESDRRSKKIKRNKMDKNKLSKKRKRSTSDSSQSEELFDVNILNNIKTERLTDDEKCQKLMEFSPRRQKPREIINVKELQNDFVGNIHIKKEIEEPKSGVIHGDVFDIGNIDSALDENTCKEKSESSQESQEIPLPPPPNSEPTKPSSPHLPEPDIPPSAPTQVPTPEIPPASAPYIQNIPINEIPEPVPPALDVSQVPTPQFPPTLVPYPHNVPLDQIPGPDESNMSQCSSQESICSVKEVPTYEKDESHLRPSSQNSNYSFNDVIASQNELYSKGIESEREEPYTYQAEASYEMYEQLAMAYQSDVASQLPSDGGGGGGGAEQRIETVVRARCGEIKCDWRAGDDDPRRAHQRPARPSRWGLKPGEVNIVLTGAGAQFPGGGGGGGGGGAPVYRIQSLANRTDNSGYDEAYIDMYGASDRLQYGDCFSADFDTSAVNASVNIDVTDAADVTVTGVTDTSDVTVTDGTASGSRTSSLDARINQALKDSILGEVAKNGETENDKDTPEKGILVTATSEQRGSKRVSFADGYKPGQDSDVEDPPVKRRKKARRVGCAWPCPAAHPDHVPLWDALPPPPPPPGSPPPAPARAPPTPRAAQLLRAARPHAHAHTRPLLLNVAPAVNKFDPTVPLPAFMPPEPPPGLISLN